MITVKISDCIGAYCEYADVNFAEIPHCADNFENVTSQNADDEIPTFWRTTQFKTNGGF